MKAQMEERNVHLHHGGFTRPTRAESIQAKFGFVPSHTAGDISRNTKL